MTTTEKTQPQSAFVTDVYDIVTIKDVNHVKLRKLGAMEIQEMQYRAQIRDKGHVYDNVFDQNMFVLKECIVSWEGPAFGDTPVTVENIKKLSADFLTPILNAVLKLLTLSDEEKKELTPPTNGTTSTASA